MTTFGSSRLINFFNILFSKASFYYLEYANSNSNKIDGDIYSYLKN